ALSGIAGHPALGRHGARPPARGGSRGHCVAAQAGRRTGPCTSNRQRTRAPRCLGIMSASRASKPRGVEGAAPTAWISHGFEELVALRDPEPTPSTVDFDVVIVGSGYGGAMAAARLAGATDAGGREVRVCVLERGREYLPGMFPPSLSDLAGHVRFSAGGSSCARGEREGLFDVRVGADVSAVVANGLGGGSLINAGVMAEPGDDVFDRPEWPLELRKRLPACSRN